MYSSVMRSVEKVLRFESARSRADALEILSNLGERDAASLLVLMLEDGPLEDKIPTVTSSIPLPASPQAILQEARDSGDRWLRMAAAAVRKRSTPGCWKPLGGWACAPGRS